MSALLYGLGQVVGEDAIRTMSTGRYVVFVGIAVALNLAGYIEARSIGA